jgi:hypothetical protein
MRSITGGLPTSHFVEASGVRPIDGGRVVRDGGGTVEHGGRLADGLPEWRLAGLPVAAGQD